MAGKNTGIEDNELEEQSKILHETTNVELPNADNSENENLCQLRRNGIEVKSCVKPKSQCKVYKRRWLILLLFSLASAFNAAHWLQYSIITNIIVKYYQVSPMYVNWSSMIYMAVYVPLVFPATWVLERKGLRIAMMLGLSMMTAGAWLKLFSLQRDNFTVAFVCQFLIGAAQIFILSVPARLAGLWFESSQVSTACAIGVFGNQLGVALSFVVPPMVVHDWDDVSRIEEELKYLHIGNAIPPSILLLLSLLLFEASPPLPPSLAQYSARESESLNKLSYRDSMKKLLTNKDYVFLLFSYGLNVGVFYAYSTLLNQLFLIHFPVCAVLYNSLSIEASTTESDESVTQELPKLSEFPSILTGEEEAGRIGLTLIVGGIVGSVIWGVILDRTHMFKGTTLLVYSMGLVGMLGFTFSLYYESLLMIYISSAFLGFFMNGYLTVAYEFAAELTYPLPESTSSGVLNAVGEALGALLVCGTGVLLDNKGDLPTNLLLTSVLIIGFFTSLFISGKNLKRLAASIV